MLARAISSATCFWVYANPSRCTPCGTAALLTAGVAATGRVPAGTIAVSPLRLVSHTWWGMTADRSRTMRSQLVAPGHQADDGAAADLLRGLPRLGLLVRAELVAQAVALDGRRRDVLRGLIDLRVQRVAPEAHRADQDDGAGDGDLLAGAREARPAPLGLREEVDRLHDHSGASSARPRATAARAAMSGLRSPLSSIWKRGSPDLDRDPEALLQVPVDARRTARCRPR